MALNGKRATPLMGVGKMGLMGLIRPMGQMGDAQNIEKFPLVLFATFVLFVPSPNFYLKKLMANG